MNFMRGAAVGATAGMIVLSSCVGDEPVDTVTPQAEAGAPPMVGVDSGNGAADSSIVNLVTDAGPDVANVPDATADAEPADSGFDAGPPAIGGVTGMSIWFSGDVNLVPATVTNVASWTSRVGEPALVLLPIESADVPTLGTINTHRSVHFAGKDPPGACPCPGLKATTLVTGTAQPMTVFVVLKSDRYTDGTNIYESVIFNDTASHLQLYTSFQSGPKLQWSAQADATKKIFAKLQTNTDYLLPHLITVVYDGAGSRIRIDDDSANDGTGDIGTDILNGILQLGSGGSAITSFKGDIGELVFYPSALSQQDRTSVATALMTKWGITTP